MDAPMFNESSEEPQDIVEWDTSQRYIHLLKLSVGFLLVTTLVFAATTVVFAMKSPDDEDNGDCYVSAECQTTFREATADELKQLHSQVRTSFWTNPAFNSNSKRQNTRKTATEMLKKREIAERDFWHEKKGEASSTYLSSSEEKTSSKPREAALSHGGIYLEGTETTVRGYSDTEVAFTQESNFLYLSGVNRPDCLFLLDIATQTSFLFVPHYDDFYATWVGEIPTLADLKELYGVDEALYNEDLPLTLEVLSQSDPENYPIYTLPGLQTDRIPANYSTEDESLLPILWEQRDVKNAFEIDLLKTAASVSADAHVDNMKKMKSGLYEYSLASNFLAYIGYCSFTHIAYETIAGAGSNSAILHYTAATAEILQDQLFLIDAGGQYRGYTTDITRTYPSGGKYSSDQTELYNMVYAVQTECIASLKPGVDFTDTMALASELICEQLIQNDFVLANVTVCLEERLFALFMPHGLGHLVGLDVHDTSVYPTTPLQPGNVLTIEPGIYFNQVLLSPAIEVGDPRFPYMNSQKISDYLLRKIGGVRIEDVVLIVDEGYEVLSDAAPTLLTEIETTMA